MSKESKNYGTGTTFDEMIDYVKNMKYIDENEANDILDGLLETILKENQDIQSCFEDYDLSIKDIRKVCVSYKQREKHEKALETIKEKGWIALDVDYENYDDWKKHHIAFIDIETGEFPLTQKEFDLLKEVLL